MRGLFASILGRTSEPTITVARHQEILGEEAKARANATARWGLALSAANKRLEEYRQENAGLYDELTNARRSNQAAMTELMTLRFKNAELVKENAELRPDAEAHRARLSRDRDYHRNRRSLKTRALSLQPASPAMSESIGH